jgi:hypothetical protein
MARAASAPVNRPTPIDDLDLQSLARALVERLGRYLDQGYLDGRTVLRDAVRAHLACSALEAEELVDTLEANGYLRFPELPDETHSRRESRWEILPHG